MSMKSVVVLFFFQVWLMLQRDTLTCTDCPFPSQYPGHLCSLWPLRYCSGSRPPAGAGNNCTREVCLFRQRPLCPNELVSQKANRCLCVGWQAMQP